MQILHIPLPFGDPLSMGLAAKNAKFAKELGWGEGKKDRGLRAGDLV